MSEPSMQPSMQPSPASPPQPIAYAGRDPHEVDNSHLNALSICHFIWGGVLGLFSCFPIIHIVIGIAFMTGSIPTTSPASPTPPPFDPKWFGLIFVVFGSIFVLLGWTLAGFTIASGFFIRRRRRRMWSVVIAALNCAVFPFGTTLGVFTLVVLFRESVRQSYEERSSTPKKSIG